MYFLIRSLIFFFKKGNNLKLLSSKLLFFKKNDLIVLILCNKENRRYWQNLIQKKTPTQFCSFIFFQDNKDTSKATEK